jgi:hypothetical protein
MTMIYPVSLFSTCQNNPLKYIYYFIGFELSILKVISGGLGGIL